MIVWGMLAGWIAQLILGRSQGTRNVNWTEVMVAGLIGSFFGGLMQSSLAGDGLALRPSGIIGSVLGAIIWLVVWQAIRGRRASRP